MLELNFKPFPVLQTPRLILRRIELDDAEAYFDLRTNDAVMQYIDRPRPATLHDMEDYIQNNIKGIEENKFIVWSITLQSDSTFVGTTSYHRIEKENYRAEIGYLLHPSYWNKGLMKEAIDALIQYGFGQMGLHSIMANINPVNDASRKLLLKCGFRKEAYFTEDFYFNGQFLDSEIYSLVNR